MPTPLAYFLTWTCYGQRLHGDARGSVDLEHNSRHTPPLPPDPQREHQSRARMSAPPFMLSLLMLPIAESAVSDLCAERKWHLLAQHARPTHVHIVVSVRDAVSPERAMSQFKARITRDLRSAKLVADDARVWTRHGSTRWINHEPGLIAAIEYVLEWQVGPNRDLHERRKRDVRARIEAMTAWLDAPA